jgi:hypothetical protein
MLPGVQRVWENELLHSQVNSHVGSWSLEWTPKFLECDCRGQNSLPRKVLYIIRKILKHRCLKCARIIHLDIWNTSYGQKKSQESNWFPTIKSQESTRFPCMQVMCNTLLESSWQGLQLCFRPHCDRRFEQEVMRLQSCGSPSCENFGTPTWESRDKKPFRCGPCGEAQNIL